VGVGSQEPGMPRCGRGLTLRDSCLVAPSFRVMQSRRKGGAKRYPSVPVFVSDGFRFALPIADTISRSRGVDRPRFASSFGPLRNRGRREDRVLAAPAVSRIAQTKGHTSIQGSWSIPAFPVQWFYGLLRALPRERLSCLRRLRFLSHA
jgi:hypothetical protein